MTPFQQLRLWLRRAPLLERLVSGAAVSGALAAIAWLIAPANGAHSTRLATQGAVSGTANTGYPGAPRAAVAGRGASSGAATRSGGVLLQGSSQSQGTAGQAAAPSASRSSTGGHQVTLNQSGCSSPQGTDQGVTARDIKAAITLVNIVGPAGNATFGVPSPREQQADYQDVIDSINAAGGVACRKIVPLFFEANPADSANLEQTCLQIVQDQVFLEIDEGAYYAYPSLADCYPQHQIPFLTQGLISNQDVKSSYPYLFGRESMDLLYSNTVFALKQRGFFSAGHGFKRLGVAYEDCEPQVDTELFQWLADAGLSGSQVVGYDFGCPTGFATPSSIEQAILKFQEAGVTNVTDAEFESNFANFTTVAEQQRFHPEYGLPDDGIVPLTYSNEAPNPQNLANAVAITADLYGLYHTPGMQPDAVTAKCQGIYTSHGGTPFSQQSEGSRTVEGEVCDELWMFAVAVDHAPSLARNALAAGLHAAQSVDFSFPWGPSNFAGTGTTYGDEYWRPLQFMPSCNCWRIIDPSFHPSFS